MGKFNQTPAPGSNLKPVDVNLHKEAYVNTTIRKLIEDYEKNNHDTIDFHREYFKSLKILLEDNLEIIDPQQKVHSDIKVIHGTSERAIAKQHENRNLRLPIISVIGNDLELDMARRRPDFNVVVEKLFDPVTRRASRVVSLAPKAVTLNFRVSLYDRYTENLNQMMEQIELLFHPHALLTTDFGNSTHAYLTDWADQSIAVAGDKENRLLIKSCLISLEAYIPTKKYLMTSSNKIHELNPGDTNSVTTQFIKNKGGSSQIGGANNPEPIESYSNQSMILSDGFTMLYNIHLPAIRNEFGGKVPFVLITPSTGGWRDSAPPSAAFLANPVNPDPTNIMEVLLSEGYAVAKYDVRGQATEWSTFGGGGSLNSYAHPDNTQYAVSAEFAAENFEVRELLDVFEVRDNIAATYVSAIDNTRVGAMGGSLGGLAASMAAAWSGKTVPYDSIVSSQTEFLEAGASAIPALSGTWGYSASSSFSDFKAVSIASFTGDLKSISSPDGVRAPYLSGPLRVYTLNSYAPREFAKLDAALRSDDIISYADNFEIRNDFMGEIATSTVPSLFQFSYDDRQRSINVHLGVYELLNASKFFAVSTGQHHSPDNNEAELMRVANIKRWFNEHIRGIPDAFGIEKPFMLMETPGDVKDYRDETHSRTYRYLDSLSPAGIEDETFVLTKVAGNNTIVNKEVSSVSASTEGTFNIEHVMLPAAQANSTSEFIDKLIQLRGVASIETSDILGKWFNEDSEVFLMSEPFEKDMAMLGPASGSFNVSADASGQFYYDIMEYNPTKPLGKWNPRVVAGGGQSWHSDGTVSSLIVPSRFQFYKFTKGGYLGIRVKNHTLFTPPIPTPEKSVFEILPFFTDYAVKFDMTEAKCFIKIPMIDYDLL